MEVVRLAELVDADNQELEEGEEVGKLVVDQVEDRLGIVLVVVPQVVVDVKQAELEPVVGGKPEAMPVLVVPFVAALVDT